MDKQTTNVILSVWCFKMKDCKSLPQKFKAIKWIVYKIYRMKKMTVTKLAVKPDFLLECWDKYLNLILINDWKKSERKDQFLNFNAFSTEELPSFLRIWK